MRPWKDCADLLALFSCDNGSGVSWFCDLVEFAALLLWIKSPYKLGDLERAYMKELHLSPLVYWSQQKRALRPLLAAGGDVLRALGVPVEGEPSTVHELAQAVAAAQVENLGPLDAAAPEYRIAVGVEQRVRELLT